MKEMCAAAPGAAAQLAAELVAACDWSGIFSAVTGPYATQKHHDYRFSVTEMGVFFCSVKNGGCAAS